MTLVVEESFGVFPSGGFLSPPPLFPTCPVFRQGLWQLRGALYFLQGKQLFTYLFFKGTACYCAIMSTLLSLGLLKTITFFFLKEASAGKWRWFECPQNACTHKHTSATSLHFWQARLWGKWCIPLRYSSCMESTWRSWIHHTMIWKCQKRALQSGGGCSDIVWKQP